MSEIRKKITDTINDKTDGKLDETIGKLDDKIDGIKNKFYSVAEKEEHEIPLSEHELPSPEFTKDMKADYTILVPQMLPIHFGIIAGILRREGFNVEFLSNTDRAVVNEGLKSVHNDTCYPALLVIGQLLDAIKSGKYDLDKTAVMVSQTGGGCRASNYLFLLKKAMEKNNLGHIPVINFNLGNLTDKKGLGLSYGTIMKMLYACYYGDMILWLKNQCEPYEVVAGKTDKTVEIVLSRLDQAFANGKYRNLKRNFTKILNAFKQIERSGEQKIKVGIVGEIYMKYSPLGNNDLAKYLISEGAEPVVTGALDFMLYSINHDFVDAKLYKSWTPTLTFKKLVFKRIVKNQELMAKIIRKNSDFTPPGTFYDVEKAAQGYISQGVKMGEGWLLTGEMVEFIHSGVNNIISAQPFGCLPNHIVAKGMIRAVKTNYPEANIVAIDYDPGASKTNQENRIKLMIATAISNEKGKQDHHIIKLKADEMAKQA